MPKREAGLELFQTFYKGDENQKQQKERTVCSFYICKIIIWQEWAEGFQTLDDLQSVDLTPEDELKVKKLLSGDAADGEELIF